MTLTMMSMHTMTTPCHNGMHCVVWCVCHGAVMVSTDEVRGGRHGNSRLLMPLLLLLLLLVLGLPEVIVVEAVAFVVCSGCC